jgi:hemerythrin-like metal-binding protein
MRLVTWDDSLSTGSPEIDRHHRETFEQINRFFDRMMQGEGLDGAVQMVAKLSLSMTEHFREEETLMSRMGFPGFAAHRAQHQNFLARFEGLKRELESGRPDAANTLFEFCTDWLKDHIQGEDKAVAAFRPQRRAA